MHHIQIPEDNVVFIDPVSEQPAIDAATGQPAVMSFKKWLYEFIIADDRLTSTPKLCARTEKMEEAFKSALANGHVWHLEDADYEALKAVVESPARRMPNGVHQKQLKPFWTAVLEAKKD